MEKNISKNANLEAETQQMTTVPQIFGKTNFSEYGEEKWVFRIYFRIFRIHFRIFRIYFRIFRIYFRIFRIFSYFSYFRIFSYLFVSEWVKSPVSSLA